MGRVISNEARVIDKTSRMIRTYTEEIHGEGYKELAEQFARKNGYTVEYYQSNDDTNMTDSNEENKDAGNDVGTTPDPANAAFTPEGEDTPTNTDAGGAAPVDEAGKADEAKETPDAE